MKNILHVTNCYPTDKQPDYGIFVKEQIDSLHPYCVNKVHFINAREKGRLEYFKYPSVDSIKKADIVHCHHLFSLLVSIPWLVLFRKKVILSFLNEFENEVKFNAYPWVRLLLCKIGVAFSNRYIFKSNPIGKDPKEVYLPNGVNTDLFYNISENDVRESSEYRIFFVSSKNILRSQKRYDLFLQVCNRLEDKYSIKVERFVASGLSRREYLENLKLSDVHLLCSDYEGSPNSVKEAMALNVPVVSRNVGNVSHMFSSLKSGYYRVVDSSNVDDICDVVYSVLTLDKKLNRDGRQLISNGNLSIDEVALKLSSIYDSL
ncbi:glycosyltransferase [Shewanella halotolerans]|uniref:glycosyltransferase n=1 Tax=Shewanella halotolerans TaxID=2864204 RepID=UPI001C6597A5|nr:glycosyltransferase [Shewanella halotolerans]QYJ88699.1 glycosyltransferase [Shewanella halotolerans]